MWCPFLPLPHSAFMPPLKNEFQLGMGPVSSAIRIGLDQSRNSQHFETVDTFSTFKKCRDFFLNILKL
jgi:hypothetical protein